MASAGEWKERKRQSKDDHNRRRVKDEEEEDSEEDETCDEPKKETSANWDTSFRRAQRQRARELIQDAQQHREEITLPDELVKRVHGMNEVFLDMVAPREAAIDSEGFQLLSAIGREQVESKTGDLVFDPHLFTEKLVTFMGGRRGSSSETGSLDWAKLGERAIRAFKKPPPLSFLHGALDIGPLIKKQRQQRAGRRKTDDSAAVSKPKQLTGFEEEEESTTKDVGHIFVHLKKACHNRDNRVHYFRFLLDPASFAHTVENLFHFSFLVKDGRAGILIDSSDKQPYIHLPESQGQSAKQDKNQAIISMDMASWRKAIDKFHITSSLIPPRDVD